MFLHAFVYHVGSGFTQLLLIIWQGARWLFLKDANLETIWGGGGRAVLYTVFPSKKNPVLWAMLYVVCVGCVF